MLASIIYTGVGLFSKLGKTGFALGIVGFIPLGLLSLVTIGSLVNDIRDNIKNDQILKGDIKFIAMITISLVPGTALTGVGLFGNKLDSNVKSIVSIVGFVALSLFLLYATTNTVKNIKQGYEYECKLNELRTFESLQVPEGLNGKTGSQLPQSV